MAAIGGQAMPYHNDIGIFAAVQFLEGHSSDSVYSCRPFIVRGIRITQILDILAVLEQAESDIRRFLRLKALGGVAGKRIWNAMGDKTNIAIGHQRDGKDLFRDDLRFINAEIRALAGIGIYLACL